MRAPGTQVRPVPSPRFLGAARWHTGQMYHAVGHKFDNLPVERQGTRVASYYEEKDDPRNVEDQAGAFLPTRNMLGRLSQVRCETSRKQKDKSHDKKAEPNQADHDELAKAGPKRCTG